jgi:hypothetical protein
MLHNRLMSMDSFYRIEVLLDPVSNHFHTPKHISHPSVVSLLHIRYIELSSDQCMFHILLNNFCISPIHYLQTYYLDINSHNHAHLLLEKLLINNQYTYLNHSRDNHYTLYYTHHITMRKSLLRMMTMASNWRSKSWSSC